MDGRYAIQIVDLIDEPHLAIVDQIPALPTLVRRLPKPFKRIIGDLSKTERVLAGLDIEAVVGARGFEPPASSSQS